MVQPSKEEFLDIVKGSGIPPLYEEIPFASPCEIYALFARPESFLFESVKGHDKIARYSFIGFDPCLSVKVKNFKTEIISSIGNYFPSDNPLITLKKLAAAYRQKSFSFLPPFQGGFAGILCYDFVQYLEKIPHTAYDDLSLPDAHFFMFDKLIVFDHLLKKSHIIYCPGVIESIKGAAPIDWKEKYDGAKCQIENIRRVLSEKMVCRGPKQSASDTKIEIKYEMKKNRYIDIVEKVKEYIAAGDIFQANISQRVSARINDKKPLDLYKILREINPVSFCRLF
jgi:anthranilate/para-aminobenzoate synthase component I